ncbi:MAG: hypothetical protein OXU23_05440 [Candidatus Poribacteria bacterium]|nr:hypothetical protein [Candidatus Poribacteria bacterium]
MNKKAQGEFNKKVQRELAKVCREAEKAYSLETEIDPVPDSAYDDLLSLIAVLPEDIPAPDLGWAEDGSLSLGWHPEDGIVTMGIYGDKLVIYNAFFNDKRELNGICPLSDSILLPNFLTMLSEFFRQD